MIIILASIAIVVSLFMVIVLKIVIESCEDDEIDKFIDSEDEDVN